MSDAESSVRKDLADLISEHDSTVRALEDEHDQYLKETTQSGTEEQAQTHLKRVHDVLHRIAAEYQRYYQARNHRAQSYGSDMHQRMDRVCEVLVDEMKVENGEKVREKALQEWEKKSAQESATQPAAAATKEKPQKQSLSVSSFPRCPVLSHLFIFIFYFSQCKIYEQRVKFVQSIQIGRSKYA